jgi:hypothetical protein
MKKLTLIIILLITASLSACGPSLEAGPCTRRVKIEYEATLGWWQQVTAEAMTYDSYSEYTEAYQEPLKNWQALEPITTCDAALIDLMIEKLTMDAEHEDSGDVMEKIIYFDLDIAHTGR